MANGQTQTTSGLPGISFPGAAVGAAATAAQQQAGVSDEMMQRIMQQILAPQEQMGGMIHTGPQVMLPQPIRPRPLPMSGPVGNVQATTRAGQQRNDFNQLISSVGNVVKQGINAKREKEDRDLMVDLSIIQAASSNPTDPHNQQLIQAIAQDPKKVKRLQKALGYNPFSGEAPPPETQALNKFAASSAQQKARQVQQAVSQQLGPQAAQQGGGTPAGMPGVPQGSAMGNLMARSPNVAQLTPAVQLQAQLIKAGVLPKSDTSLQSMTTLLKEIMTSDAKYAEVQGKLQQTDMAAAARLAEIRARGKVLMDIQKMRDIAAGQRTERRAQATEHSADVRSAAVVKASKNREAAITRRTELTKQHKLLSNQAKLVQNDINGLNLQITQATNDHDDVRKNRLIQEQQMKKEQLNLLENLMGSYDKEGQQIDDQLKQSPTELLNEPDANQGGDLSKEMDQEDRIF